MLYFLPWEPRAELCLRCGMDLDPRSSYEIVPVEARFRPFAAAFTNDQSCATCYAPAFDLEIGIASASVPGQSVLCDRLHIALELSRIRLSRGLLPWHADIHFDLWNVNYTAANLELPWLHYHYFGLFDWQDEPKPRLARFADTVMPYLLDKAPVINDYAYRFRQPHFDS